MNKKVHITDQFGKLLFNNLLDNGTNAISFSSGYGFIDKMLISSKKYQVKAGWIK